MKTKYYFYLFLFPGGLFQACTPDETERFDLTNVKVDKIELMANHRQLIADGVSELTFNPRLFQNYDYTTTQGLDTTVFGVIPKDRLTEGEVNYFLEDGTPIEGGSYKTTDLSKAELGFYATFNDLKSNVFKATIRAPFPADTYQEITYPVVFHIVQDKLQNDLGQGMGSDIIYHAMELINNAFSRKVSASPNGANAKVYFRLAEYNPGGKKMAEKGIDRQPMTTDQINALDEAAILADKQLNWDYKKYLNIWLVGKNDIDHVATPRHILNTVDPAELLKGLTMTALSETEIEAVEPLLTDIGMIFYANNFATEETAYATEMGKFFGLLKTEYEDYCDDTFTYQTYREPWDKSSEGANSRLKITTNDPEGVIPLIFYSVNIMDASTYKNTISMDQVKRVRAITDNCPHRWAWKSTWAFTGKE